MAHLAAGAAMALVLRHGLASHADLAARCRFLVASRPIWIASWLLWHAAAFSYLWFVIRFAATCPGPRGLCTLALILTGCAVTLDLSAQAIQMGLLPDLAARNETAALLSWDRLSVLLTGYAANGLYTLATLSLIWARRRSSTALMRLGGAGVLIGGGWLSVAALGDSLRGLIASNALLIPALTLWLLAVARDASQREQASLGGE